MIQIAINKGGIIEIEKKINAASSGNNLLFQTIETRNNMMLNSRAAPQTCQMENLAGLSRNQLKTAKKGLKHIDIR